MKISACWDDRPFTPTIYKVDISFLSPPSEVSSSFLLTNLNYPTLIQTAEMKLLYLIFPLVSSTLAISRVQCPCHIQDCSKEANASGACPCIQRKLTSSSRPVPVRIRILLTSISAAMPTPYLPKTLVLRSSKRLHLVEYTFRLTSFRTAERHFPTCTSPKKNIKGYVAGQMRRVVLIMEPATRCPATIHSLGVFARILPAANSGTVLLWLRRLS